MPTGALSKQRILSALRVAFIGDAASLGTHWIYKPIEFLASVPSLEAPEFKDPPTPAFYSAKEFPGHYDKVGMLSPYGEQLLFVTTHCAANSDIPSAAAMLEWAETFGGRPDSALNTFVKNAKADKKKPGADDNQAHCFLKAVPVTCLYAGQAILPQKVEAAIRLHQENNVAVAVGLASSCILEAVLLGNSLSQALETCEDQATDEGVQKSFQRAKAALGSNESLDDMVLNISHDEMVGQEDSPFYDLAARSCASPGAFTVSLYLLLQAAAGEAGVVTPASIVKALRANILVGGDTCSRAILIGGILGAAAGAVPEEWEAKMDATTLEKVNDAATKISDQALSTCTA